MLPVAYVCTPCCCCHGSEGRTYVSVLESLLIPVDLLSSLPSYSLSQVSEFSIEKLLERSPDLQMPVTHPAAQLLHLLPCPSPWKRPCRAFCWRRPFFWFYCHTDSCGGAAAFWAKSHHLGIQPFNSSDVQFTHGIA